MPTSNITVAAAAAVAVTPLSVIPAGNLLFAFAVASLVVIPAGNLLFAVAFAVAVLVVIPEGNLLFALASTIAFRLVTPKPNPLHEGARLQPCHPTRRSKAASAAEVHLTLPTRRATA